MEGIHLMQLPEELLEAVLREETKLTFVGNESDHVVLTTESESYSVRIAETTNSMLIVPEAGSELLPEGEVEAVGEDVGNDGDARLARYITNTLFEYYELTRTTPKTRRLRELLKAAAYAGAELEEATAGSGGIGDVDALFSTEQLLDAVQASEAELFVALAELGAVEMDGKWRTLAPEYTATLLDLVITVADELGTELTIDPLDIRTVLAAAPEYNPVALEHVCLLFTDERDDGSLVLSAGKVARFKGVELLRLATSDWVLSEFLAAWRSTVPVDFHAAVDLATLYGTAVVTAPARRCR
ncbi:sister chromatid cohesion protein DCC1 [Thecamonas trahens ATCC 50062]|uniref:Sister chromatid cohesion protein DCC1 n=1 Tax=Thecamonas trahens ATCC 50062 TaxID=461836 RepID=A0A0L0DL05_THETB|nr:sister chromatid cohesion protein DCC1 [Thecamonas trahens ATCC 50062]KNC52935.1 sister chromatid cohesion protein DCC1 [Thecamonas trahens ATCC 50062]|eukprot:XP_013754830.1 sister chromatid cohesion protein DCC1 [Thecamonas trahens ATCC 50062]